MSDDNRPHPKNAPGPFYVVNGCCTYCAVPFVEAPNLFALEDDHCYVERQPENDQELYRMLRSVRAAELDCIRYRGQDPDVLRRLAEFGAADRCDVPTQGTIQEVVRNHVTFDAAAPEAESFTPRELASAFRGYIQSLYRDYPDFELHPVAADTARAAFSYSWSESRFHRIEVFPVSLPGCRWLLRTSRVDAPHLQTSVSTTVDDWLRTDTQFCHIRWYSDEQWNGSREWQATPL
jgi:hypothetical protein